MIVATSFSQKHRTEEHIEYAVEDRLSKLNDKERCEFIGRLVELLVTKSIITPADAGNLFYEDWAP